MKSRIGVFTLNLAVLFAMAACEAEPVRVTNGSRPSQSTRNWHLKEEWRTDPRKIDVIFGSIADVTTDKKGNIYLLDIQQQDTYVFGPGGKFLKTLGHQSEDPDETTLTLDENAYTQGSRDGTVDESKYFNPLEGRWDVDPQGRVWFAPERDRYFLKVLDPEGRTVMETMREFTSVTRSLEETRKIRRSLEEMWKKSREPIVVGTTPPCINKLWIMENRWGTEVWIESGASHHDLPPGVMVRYDIFDLDGKFTHQVDIVGDGDPLFDRWYLVGDNRLIMVRNASAGGYQEGDPSHPRPEDQALEVISYRIIWEE